MRLFRTSFILAAGYMLMPAPPEAVLRQAGFEVTAPQLISAAASTVSDLSSFCARQPAVCETAGYVAGHVEARAKYGVILLYEWAAEAQPGGSITEDSDYQATLADPIETGGITEIAQTDPGGPPSNTLKLEDYIPEWRGPADPPEG